MNNQSLSLRIKCCLYFSRSIIYIKKSENEKKKKILQEKLYFLKTLFVLMCVPYTMQVIYVYLDYGTLVKLN